MEKSNECKSIDVFDGIQPSNEIWYTTYDGSICQPMQYVGGPEVVDNRHENGKGVIVFDQDLKDGAITFYNDALTAISFPNSYSFDSYKKVGCYLFFPCMKLERIKYKGGDGRFLIVDDYLINVANSDLSEIILPEGVKVKEDAFLGENDKLEIVHVGKGSSLMEGALARLSNLKKIYGEYATSSRTSWIENNTFIAFATGSHTHCEIPDGVTRIGRNAFSSSHLKSVKIPSSVSSVGFNAFGRLTQVRMTGKNVDKNQENLVVDGKLLLHFHNPKLGFMHPAVIPEGVRYIDCNVTLDKETKDIVFPSSLEFLELDFSDPQNRTIEFLGTVPPRIMFLNLDKLEKKRETNNRGNIKFYENWKQGGGVIRPYDLTTSFWVTKFTLGFVPSLDDKLILLDIIVPKGSLEDYRRAYSTELERYEKVIEISERK